MPSQPSIASRVFQWLLLTTCVLGNDWSNALERGRRSTCNALALESPASLGGACALQAARTVSRQRSAHVQTHSRHMLPWNDLDQRDANLTLSSSRTLGLGIEKWHMLFFAACALFAIGYPIIERNSVLKSLDVERALFNDLRREEKADTSRGFAKALDHISVDCDGGLDKIGSLIPSAVPSLQRLITFWMRLAMLIFNITVLCCMDIAVMEGSKAFYQGESLEGIPPAVGEYLTGLWHSPCFSVWQAALIAFVELLCLVGHAVSIIYKTVVFWMYRNDPAGAQFDAFISLYSATDQLYEMATFSAMQLFNKVHPELVGRKFQTFKASLRSNSTIYQASAVLYFVGSRAAAAWLSLLAFGIKLAFVSLQLNRPLDPGVEGYWKVIELGRRWCYVLSLFLQSMCALLIPQLLKWRLLHVIATGSNSQVDADGTAIRKVYRARLVQTMYETYWVNGRKFAFFMLLFTFDDSDLQCLLFEEDAAKKLARMQVANSAAQTGSESLGLNFGFYR